MHPAAHEWLMGWLTDASQPWPRSKRPTIDRGGRMRPNLGTWRQSKWDAEGHVSLIKTRKGQRARGHLCSGI